MKRRSSTEMEAVPRVEIHYFSSSQRIDAVCRGHFGEAEAVRLLRELEMKSDQEIANIFVLDVSGVRTFDTAELSDPLARVLAFVRDKIGRHMIFLNRNQAFGMFFRALVLGKGIRIYNAESRAEIVPTINDIRANTSVDSL